MESFLASPEFQMSLLLFVALAGYLLAARINQSAVIGEILVGLLVGPSLLGLITYTEFVQGLAHIGAVVLLFVIGLEFKLGEVIRPKNLLIALAGIIVPWGAGYGVARAFGYPFAPALFVGTALTATSIAITANVLREMGRLQSDAAKAIIGAAVIDDVLGLVALSLTSGIVGGTFSAASLLLTLLKAAAFLAAGAIIGATIASRLLRRLDESAVAKRYPEFLFILAMAMAFMYAMAAEAIGLSAIVGAFIAGVSLESVRLRHSKDFREGAEYLHIIFAAVFFVSLGILADFHALTWQVLLFLVALSLAAIVTKVVGCGLPARAQGMSWKDSLVVGIGMSPRGEVAMIIALIGLNQGYFGQDIYLALVLMSLLTTVATPMLLRGWLFAEQDGAAGGTARRQAIGQMVDRSLRR